MKAMKLTAEQRKEWNRQVKQANAQMQKQIDKARHDAAEAGIGYAKNWLETDGARQMFKAMMAVVYYTLHKKRPGKGFDSKRGIISFHNDLVEMMNENITDYCFTSDDDAVFVCNYWLKELGVNLDKLPMPINFELQWK